MDKKRTKFLGMLIALTMLFSFVGSSAEGVMEVYADTVKTVTARVNFRTGPSTSYSVICKINKGTKVTYISKTGNWSKIKYNSKTGYVSSSYLSGSSSKADRIVSYAKSKLGCKYVWATQGPNTFDCSGFTTYVYKHFGISLNRSSKDQIKNGTSVSKSNLKLGDIIIFKGSSNTSIGHVGIYIGDNKFIHAANSKEGVIITSLSSSYYQKRYVGARRVI